MKSVASAQPNNEDGTGTAEVCEREMKKAAAVGATAKGNKSE
jgi:hypothetical protein